METIVSPHGCPRFRRSLTAPTLGLPALALHLPETCSHPALDERRRQANRWLLLALAATLLVASVLRAFPPGVSAFYPPCPFREWTGLLCPGCGGTRAVAALADGNLREALRSNPLVVMALAAGTACLARAYYRALRGRGPLWPSAPLPAVLAAGICALLFAIARNLP